jgi:hypothetical protein
MDFHTKSAIRALKATSLPRQQRFPLEPMCAFIGQHKLSADMGNHLRFWSHLKMVRSTYHSLNILNSNQFDLIDWQMVHSLLRGVPKFFQLWVCKQVANIAATNANNYRWNKSVGLPLCPSCMQVPETCGHVLQCCHDGRVETLFHSINIMDQWLSDASTEPTLKTCLVEYAQGQGGVSMTKVC